MTFFLGKFPKIVPPFFSKQSFQYSDDLFSPNEDTSPLVSRFSRFIFVPSSINETMYEFVFFFIVLLYCIIVLYHQHRAVCCKMSVSDRADGGLRWCRAENRIQGWHAGSHHGWLVGCYSDNFILVEEWSGERRVT